MTGVVAGAAPNLEFTIGVEEGVENLRDERLRLRRLAMDVIVVTRVTLLRGVEVAAERDAHLHRTKRLADACELYLTSKTALDICRFRSDVAS